jgi:hypothetical protein
MRWLTPRSMITSKCSTIAPGDTAISALSVRRRLKPCRNGLNGVRKRLGSPSMLRRYFVRRKEARLVQGATLGHRSRSVTSCYNQTKTAAPLLEPPSVMTRWESRLRCLFPPPHCEAQETCTEQEQGRGFWHITTGVGHRTLHTNQECIWCGWEI